MLAILVYAYANRIFSTRRIEEACRSNIKFMYLLEEDLRGKDVIDAGTGTGVLSIMSILRGARHVLAYDIDEWSVNNAKDNLLLNGMGSAQVEVHLGNSGF